MNARMLKWCMEKTILKMGVANGEFLSEHYRNLDRVVTMAIPWILENVGYKMVKLKKT